MRGGGGDKGSIRAGVGTCMIGKKSPDTFDFRRFLEYLKKYLTYSIKNMFNLVFLSRCLIPRAIKVPTTNLIIKS